MNIKNKIILIAFAILLGTIFFSSKVSAASASLSASSTNVEIGTPVTITTRINGAAWQINVSGAVSGAYTDNTDDAEDTTLSKTLSFTPSSAGTYTVSLSGNVTGSSDNSSTPVSDSVTINVTEPPTRENTSNNSSNNSNTPQSEETEAPTQTTTQETKKSGNANLANLGITPNDFRGFKSGTTSYNVTVPNNVEQVNVYAKLQDSKAKITSGTGNQKLNVGQNSLKVVVTAEDGTTKTYTINVAREETAEATNASLIKLEIEGYTISPKFSPTEHTYTLKITDDVNSLKVITEGANRNVNIEVVRK